MRLLNLIKTLDFCLCENILAHPGNVRNAGIRIAAGKFISFLDSDDYWDKSVLTELITQMKKTKEKCLVYGTLDFFGNGQDKLNYHDTHNPFFWIWIL